MNPFRNGWFSVAETINGMPIPKQEEVPNHVEAFSNGVAGAIKERDGHSCKCGRSQHDGWYIDASHLNHDRKNPYYNNIGNGVTECKIHHLSRHIGILVDIWTGDSNLNESWARASIGLLTRAMWSQGLNSYRPVSFEDRQEINAVFDKYGIDISEFINLTEYISQDA